MQAEEVVSAVLGAVDPSGKRPQAVLARRMSVDRQVVNRWVREGYIPAYRAFDVEAVTAGKVTARQVCEAEKERRAVMRRAMEERRYGTD